VLTGLETIVILPDINLANYHAAALVLSVLVFVAQAPLTKAILIAIVLVTDWLDGATARKYERASRSGYFTDLVTDRASEAFIFAAESETVVGQAFFLLWIVNTILSFYSANVNRHLSLPLRFAYMVILLAKA
jgi:phosphatidylglycerophosphate synthase